jgi:hypothetical protein
MYSAKRRDPFIIAAVDCNAGTLLLLLQSMMLLGQSTMLLLKSMMMLLLQSR